MCVTQVEDPTQEVFLPLVVLFQKSTRIDKGGNGFVETNPTSLN